MELIDFVVSGVYIVLILLIAFLFRNYNKHDKIYRKYLIPGIMVKILGAILFVMVYTYYYDYGGDASTYFHDALIFYNLLMEDPIAYIKLIIKGSDYAMFNHREIVQETYYSPGQSEWFTAKIASVICFFGLSNYLLSTILFSVFSFTGVWLLFLTFARRYPQISGKLAIATLFIPSVFFWGSGIMKDSIVIGFVGVVIHFSDRLVSVRGIRKIIPLSLILISSYIIFNTKAYVIMSLVPAILLWIVMNYKEKIRSTLFRRIIFPVLLIFLSVIVASTIQFLGTKNSKYSIDNVVDTAQGMQSWHQVQTHLAHGEQGRGSSYDLGEYDETLWGILMMAPASINVTLFRPYPTEVTSIVMAFASLESLIILLASIYVFIGLGIHRIPKILNNDAFLLMALTFSIFFAFAVGFSSYNFGALVRYKIPCIPLFVSSLFILQYKSNLLKKNKLKFR